MVAVFSSSNHDAEMEAMNVKGVLEASGIPALLVGPHVLPNLEFQVQVPENLLDDARTIIRDARQDGRRAAAEGEAETEGL
jgi:hypothetical protein